MNRIMPNLKSFLLAALIILVYGINIKAQIYELEKHVAVFVFGDSVYDPGNNNYVLSISADSKANRWPYGETFFHNPTGRYCDGRIVPDFIAMDVKLPPWKPYLEQNGTQQSFLNGSNFAAGGAHAISEISPQWINLKDQLSFFKDAVNKLKTEVGEEEAKKILMEAVYLSSIGGDDYATFTEDYPNSTVTQKQEFVKLVIGNITDVIMEIYELGGRKFAFQNIGPMGCQPFARQMYDGECDEELMEMLQLHNHALPQFGQELESHLQGFNFLIFDYYTSLNDIMQNPSKYGFKTADVACCGYGTYRGEDCGIEPYELCSNPNEYVYFDGEHPGERTNALLSPLLWNDESSVFTFPRNLKQLIDLQIPSNFTVQNYISSAAVIDDFEIKNRPLMLRK